MSESARDTAAVAIRSLVTRGRCRPGDRLPPERELAAALGMSRPTVREAIRRLTAEGLLEARQGSGTYVAQIDLDAVFAVRLQLEPYAAALAALRRPTAPLSRLAELVEALQGQVEDAEAFAATDAQIHRTIAEAGGNVLLCEMLDRLADLTAVSRAITSPARDARMTTLRHLRTLVRAVRASDPDTASAAMEAHLGAMRHVAARQVGANRRLARVAGDAAA